MEEDENQQSSPFWSSLDSTEDNLQKNESSTDIDKNNADREIVTKMDYGSFWFAIVFMIVPYLFLFSIITDTFQVFSFECELYGGTLQEVEGEFRCFNGYEYEKGIYDSSGTIIVDPIERFVGIFLIIVSAALTIFLTYFFSLNTKRIKFDSSSYSLEFWNKRPLVAPRLKRKVSLNSNSYISVERDWVKTDSGGHYSNVMILVTEDANPVDLYDFTLQELCDVSGLKAVAKDLDTEKWLERRHPELMK